MTPLHVAAMKGHAAILGFLVEAGADKDAKDNVSEGRGLDHGRTYCQRDEG